MNSGAGIRNPALSLSLQQTTGENFVGQLIQSLITLGFVVGGIIFIFTLVTGGIGWMSANGDKAKLEQAREKLTHAIVGLVILFSVFAIVGVADAFFGISLTTIDFGALRIDKGSGTPLPPCVPGKPC